jgi:hypothetical protein
MVREFDEASRGKKLPERAEKKAESGANGHAFNAMPTSHTVPKPKSPKASNTTKFKREVIKGGPERIPWPGDYQDTFLENSASAAQRSSEEKFQEGKQRTMPITQ